MIWFLLAGTALTAAVFLFAPALRPGSPQRGLFAGLALLAALAIAGLYYMTGRPDLTAPGAVSTIEPAPRAAPAPAGEAELVERLKTKLLSSGSEDPEGWALLARSQMQIGQYDEALLSYETLLSLNPDDPSVQDEVARARAFIERRSLARASENMTPEDRQAMINSMVEGLAARIYENGGTPEEWARLIRSRKVLGQEALLAKDIERLKQQFEASPEIITDILGE